MSRVALWALCVLSCQGGAKKTAPPSGAAAAAPAPRPDGPPAVRVERARERGADRSERYIGEIAAVGTLQLMSNVGGRVVEVRKRLGDRVRKGEIVAVMDDEELLRQMNEAKVAIDVARAQVRRADVDRARLERELARTRALHAREVVPVRDLENAQAGFDLAVASLALARTQVAQAEARVETLAVQLRNTRIRAPFAGRVNRRYLEPGALLVSMNPAPIVEIVTDELVVRFKIPERELGQKPIGKEVSVRVEAFPGEVFRGKITRLSAVLETPSRSALAEARLEGKPGGRLRPGMFARVDVLWESGRKVVVVPQKALVRISESGAESAVFVVEAGRARRVPVRMRREHGEEVEVEGVTAGAEVIVEGHEELPAEAPVRVHGMAKAP